MQVDEDRLDRRAIANLTSLVSEMLVECSTICDDLSNVVRTDVKQQFTGGTIKAQDLKGLYSVALEKVRQNSPKYLGMGFAANPKVFQEPFLLWWYAAVDSAELRPLNVRVQPENLTFYDYTVSLWWKRAFANDRAHITGPYVDHSGTNAYVVTVSQGVIVDDLNIGVVAVDVLVSTLQTIWHPHLHALPKPSCLIDEDGVVVATNSGKHLGSCLKLNEDDMIIPVPGSIWQLVVEKAT